MWFELQPAIVLCNHPCRVVITETHILMASLTLKIFSPQVSSELPTLRMSSDLPAPTLW